MKAFIFFTFTKLVLSQYTDFLTAHLVGRYGCCSKIQHP